MGERYCQQLDYSMAQRIPSDLYTKLLDKALVKRVLLLSALDPRR